MKNFYYKKPATRISNQLFNIRYLPNSKRSQGHIEMIISFILFVGAVLFIFFYINPFSKTVDNSNEINQVQNVIIQNITATVGRLSVITHSGGCYTFSDADYGTNYVEVPGESPGIYTIYFGDADIFDKNSPHKDSCPLNYTLGIFSNQSIISYERLLQLVNDSTYDYNSVKKNLGINMEFSINTTDFNQNPIPELSFSRNTPKSIEVESKELPMIAINKSGSSNTIIFNLKVWG